MNAPAECPGTRRRALRRSLLNPAGLAGLIIVAFWVLAAFFGPMLLGDQAASPDTSRRLEPPSTQHWLGTDALGRDVLARVLVATQLTFRLTFSAMAIGLALGLFVGVLASVLGRAARQVLYQVVAAATAFPSIIMALLLATLLGRGGTAAMLGLALASVPSTARLVLNLTSTVSAMDYVANAKMLGVPRFRLMWRYIVPNVAEPIVTLAVVTMGAGLMMLSAMSFLGIGVQLPEYDWGGMISESMGSIYLTPWATLGPAAAIVTAGIGFSLLGEKLADLLDPRGLVMTASRAARRPRPRLGRRRARSTPAAQPASMEPAAAPEPEPEPEHETARPMPQDTVLGVQNLRVSVAGGSGSADRHDLVKGIDLHVRAGERLGIVGESGSGKSLSISALAHMLPGTLTLEADHHVFDGQDLRGLSAARRRRLIGARLPMIFQDPMSSLNPALTIGRQMMDKVQAHTALRGPAARAECARALASVGIPEPAARMRQHPHQLSGGQRQRVMIAMATLAEPSVILADEPTTALDVSVQAQVTGLLREINDRDGVAIVMVSHDLALISQICDRVIVMYDGRIVEEGPTRAVIGSPQHPYTRALLGAVPDLTHGTEHRLTTITDYSWNTDEYRRAPGPAPRGAPRHQPARHRRRQQMSGELVADDVRLSYGHGARQVHAVRGVSVRVSSGRALGIAGESGSGKSSLARVLVGMVPPDSGTVSWNGRDISGLPTRGPGSRARLIQMVFQDPMSSLNPRMTVGEAIREVLHVNDIPGDRRGEVIRLLRTVDLDEQAAAKYPFQFSGGQRQRVALARALAARPEALVADEATSALDVSVQAAVLNLLRDIREQTGLALAVVSHNLDVLRYLCDDIVVMREGLVVEAAAAERLFADPSDPYTRMLLDAVPRFSVPPGVDRRTAR